MEENQNVGELNSLQQFSESDVNGIKISDEVVAIIAGIAASGKTEIYNLTHIDRGYENIEEKFRKLGAKIERVIEEE